MRPGAKWSGCAAPGLGVREDTDMTKEQKVIRAKVSLLSSPAAMMVAGMQRSTRAHPRLGAKGHGRNRLV